MALTITSRGTGTNGTAGTTYNINPATSFVAGNTLGILALTYDPITAADPFSSISDALGNTWTTELVRTNIVTGSTGVIVRVFSTPFNVGVLATTNAITITFTSAVTAKAYGLLQCTSSISGAIVAVNQITSATGTSTTPSVTSGTIRNGSSICFGIVGAEGNDTRTADADTTNGTWTAWANVGVGTGATGIQMISQYKTQTTADSTQTYNPTISASEIWVAIAGEVLEQLLFDPFGQNGYFGI